MDCQACDFEHPVLYSISCCKIDSHTILDTVVLLAFDSSLLFALLKAARYYSQVKHRHPGPTVVPRRLFNILNIASK